MSAMSTSAARLRPLAMPISAAIVLMIVAPAVLSDFRLNLLAKYLCLAVLAVGIGIAWGRGGLLVLGQGVFFGIGGYAMAMHLKLLEAGPGGVPDFMNLYGTGELPWWWEPFRHAWFALPATILLPAAVAGVLGWAVFRRGVRGAYFAILSQALAAAMVILLVGNQATTGGTNGLTNFTNVFGYDPSDPVNRRTIYFVVAGVLIVVMLLARQLMRSRYGELLVAVRDSEARVRFLGYDPAAVKVTAYMIAAGMAGLAGALFVPAVGIISPALIGVLASLEFVVGVAIGGRAALLGPVIGTVAVAAAKTSLSEQFPSGWIYFQAGMFILVLLFLPNGIASLADRARRRREPVEPPPPDPGVVTGDPVRTLSLPDTPVISQTSPEAVKEPRP